MRVLPVRSWDEQDSDVVFKNVNVLSSWLRTDRALDHRIGF